ncbi:MAG: hypothetical protein ACI85U_000103 [Candidatus Promineifilaceae bacterium]|jgi:hypothetical protein
MAFFYTLDIVVQQSKKIEFLVALVALVALVGKTMAKAITTNRC